jgi:hypothetical protein
MCQGRSKRGQGGGNSASRKRQEKDLEQLENQIELYCQKLRQGLASFDFEDKLNALKPLQVKASVTETDVRVRGILGVAETGGKFSHHCTNIGITT